MLIRRGDIWLSNSGDKDNKHAQNGTRPILILSNWKFLETSDIVNCIPLTSKDKLSNGSAHVEISKNFRLDNNTIALCEQITTIDKKNLVHFISRVTEDVLVEIQNALNIQLGFKPIEKEVLTVIKTLINELEDFYHLFRKNSYKNINTDLINEMICCLKDLKHYIHKNNVQMNLYKYESIIKKVICENGCGKIAL